MLWGKFKNIHKASALIGLGISAFAGSSIAADGALQMLNPALSPNGENIAYIQKTDGEMSLVIMNFNTGASKAMPAIDGLDFYWHTWANNSQLLVSFSHFVGDKGDMNVDVTRLVGVDKDIKEVKNLFQIGAKNIPEAYTKLQAVGRVTQQGEVIDLLPNEPDYVLVNVDADANGQAEVRKVSVYNGDYSIAQKEDDYIQHWVSDQGYVIRFGYGDKNAKRAGRGKLSTKIMSELGSSAIRPVEGVEKDKQRDMVATYLNPDSGEWLNVEKQKWLQDGGDLLSFSADPHVAYIKTSDGKIELVNLATGQKVADISTHEAHLITTPDLPINVGAPIGYRDAQGAHYTDPNYAGLLNTVNGVFKTGMSEIVSAAPSIGKFVILNQNDKGVGAYYLLDMRKGSLDKLADKLAQ